MIGFQGDERKFDWISGKTETEGSRDSNQNVYRVYQYHWFTDYHLKYHWLEPFHPGGGAFLKTNARAVPHPRGVRCWFL